MLHPRLYYDTCRSLLSHGSSLQRDRSSSMCVHVRYQTDNPIYGSIGWLLAVRDDKEELPCVRRYSWWVPAVRGIIIFFARNMDAVPCVRRCSWWVPAVRGKCFFVKYGGPSGGSLLSGGGIIILHVIRRHFLAAAMDPIVSLSTYSPHPMEAVPC